MSRESEARISAAEIVDRCNGICKEVNKLMGLALKADLSGFTDLELAQEVLRRANGKYQKQEQAAPEQPVKRHPTDFGWARRPRRTTVPGAFGIGKRKPRRTTVPGEVGRKEHASGHHIKVKHSRSAELVKAVMAKFRITSPVRLAALMHVRDWSVYQWVRGKTRPMDWRWANLKSALRTGDIRRLGNQRGTTRAGKMAKTGAGVR